MYKFSEQQQNYFHTLEDVIEEGIGFEVVYDSLDSKHTPSTFYNVAKMAASYIKMKGYSRIETLSAKVNNEILA